MTRELGYSKLVEHEFWHVFAEQALQRFDFAHDSAKPHVK